MSVDAGLVGRGRLAARQDQPLRSWQHGHSTDRADTTGGAETSIYAHKGHGHSTDRADTTGLFVFHFSCWSALCPICPRFVRVLYERRCSDQGVGGLDGVPMWIGGLGVAGLFSGRNAPGDLALLIAVQTRSARSGSDAMARAACTSSVAVRPFRLRITRRVESRIRLSNVVSSCKRSSSTIVRTKVESFTAEVGMALPVQATRARTVPADTTKRRVSICCNAIGLHRSPSTAASDTGRGACQCRRHRSSWATGMRRSWFHRRERHRGVPYQQNSPSPRRSDVDNVLTAPIPLSPCGRHVGRIGILAWYKRCFL